MIQHPVELLWFLSYENILVEIRKYFHPQLPSPLRIKLLLRNIKLNSTTVTRLNRNDQDILLILVKGNRFRNTSAVIRTRSPTVYPFAYSKFVLFHNFLSVPVFLRRLQIPGDFRTRLSCNLTVITIQLQYGYEIKMRIINDRMAESLFSLIFFGETEARSWNI